MSCSDYRMKISEAIDRPLPESDAVSLQQHLGQCSTCSSFELEQREFTRLLRDAAPDLEPPARIWANIESRIQAHSQAAQAKRQTLDRLRDLFRLPQWGYAMAGLALAAAMGVTVFQWNSSTNLEGMLAELDAYQPEVRSNPFLQVDHDLPRNPFGDFGSEK